MSQNVSQTTFLLLLVSLVSVTGSHQLQSSQRESLLKLQQLLSSLNLINSWNEATDFCSWEPTSNLTIVCYEDSITQLHIVGETGAPQLSQNFSMSSFVGTLAMLPSLKVLRLVSLGLWGSFPSKLTLLSSLELLNLTSNFFQGNIPESISSMTHLETLILDGNNFTGRIPDVLDSLPSLVVLSLKNNSFHGSLPRSLGSLENLRVLALSNNKFSGEVPDLSRLVNLQVLDVENNALGPQFPVVSDNIERIVLRNNMFSFGIPDSVISYNQLKSFIISSNRFVGPFPVSLLSLPFLNYLDIAQNKFTGMLAENLPCSDDLEFVNMTANMLTGRLPNCLLSGSKKRVVLYSDNCLTRDKYQKSISFCKNEALAVGISPHSRKQKRASKLILALSIFVGVVGVAIIAGATFFLVKRLFSDKAEQNTPRHIPENASAGYTSKLLQDARYIAQTIKVGALGLPSYRTFSLEELEQATRNFHASSFLGEGSISQICRGRLRDGCDVAIRILKPRRNHSNQYFMPHIEMMSKLKHHHLVCALGHCFEYCLDDSSVSRVFLIFEYVPNGTLRSWISEKNVQQKLTWDQRIAAASGVAKGIQFLHTGIMPGIVSNNLKITDILLDQNLVAKISSYNLPLLADNMGNGHRQNFFGLRKAKSAREKHHNKSDIYDFGVILLELITGKPVNSRNEVEILKGEFQASLVADETSRMSVIDPLVRNVNTCSLKTMVKICSRCLIDDHVERPSIEDVIWNLQFAAQVQGAWSSDSSPNPSMRS